VSGVLREAPSLQGGGPGLRPGLRVLGAEAAAASCPSGPMLQKLVGLQKPPALQNPKAKPMRMVKSLVVLEGS
jgi:hypothetical protein